MTNAQTKRGFSIRAFITRVLACVFVLQAVAFAVSHERVGDVGLGFETGVAISAGYCGADMGRDKGAPTTRHDHSQCCILCSSNGDGGLIRFATVLFDVLLAPSVPTAPAGWRFLDDLTRPPVGLTSSWSSRAPPSFS